MNENLNELRRQRDELDRQIKRAEVDTIQKRNEALYDIEFTVEAIASAAGSGTDLITRERKCVKTLRLEHGGRVVEVSLHYADPPRVLASPTTVTVEAASWQAPIGGMPSPKEVEALVRVALGLA